MNLPCSDRDKTLVAINGVMGKRPHLPHAPRCPTAEGWILATQDRQAVAGRRSDLPASESRRDVMLTDFAPGRRPVVRAILDAMREAAGTTHARTVPL